MTSTLDFPYKEDVGGSIPSAPTGISRSARPLTGGSARSLRKSERQESGKSFRDLFQRRTYTARERWMRTAMQNLLWSGLGATMLGLVGGLKAITGPVQDAVYRQAPLTGTGAVVMLIAGPLLILASAAVADRAKDRS